MNYYEMLLARKLAKGELPPNAYLLKTASGSLVSFSDGADLPMPSFICNISANQDLHGYDHPWVGGAGKNKFDTTESSRVVDGVTFTVNDDGTVVANGTSNVAVRSAFFIGMYTITDNTVLINGCPSGGASNKFELMAFANNKAVSDYGNGASLSTFSVGDTIQILAIVRAGYTANNLVFKPMIRLATETDATFAPYSNICPISGWDEVNVTRTGKNLFDESILLECSGWAVSDGVYSGDSAQVNAKYGNGVPNLAFKPNTQYTFGFTYGQDGSAGIGLAIAIKYTDDTSTQKYCALESVGFVSVTSTVGKSIKRIELSYGANRTIHLSNMQLEEGTTATTYEPYNGATYTIDLDGTRYGGTLDVVSGELTVDRVGVDMANLNWTNSSSNHRSYCYDLKNVIKIPSSQSAKSGCIAEKYFEIPSTRSLIDGGFAVAQSGDLIFYYDGVNPPTGQLVYPLATPQTIQLTPTQVKSLLGSNNVWADTGDVDIEYFGKGDA